MLPLIINRQLGNKTSRLQVRVISKQTTQHNAGGGDKEGGGGGGGWLAEECSLCLHQGMKKMHLDYNNCMAKVRFHCDLRHVTD